MSKLLSQEEIDALLASEDEGEKKASSKKVESDSEYRLYDFRRPDRISKDQQRILRNIHENFGKLLSTYLSNTLRTMVDVKSPIIDQVTYLEFTMSAADFTNMFVFHVENLEGQAILEVDPNFTNYIIDREFGGEGSVINRGETITIIEESLMTSISNNILSKFHEAWEHVTELHPVIDNFESNPQLITIAPSSETMLILNFPIIVKNYDFYIYLCFPYFMLEPVLKKIMTQDYMSMLKKDTSDEEKAIIRENIEYSLVDFIVEIGKTKLPIQDFLALQEGDIIRLDKNINEMAVAQINHKQKFVGNFGKNKKNYAFRLAYFINDEGEIFDEQLND